MGLRKALGELVVLKGHGFSHAERGPKGGSALAAEGLQSAQNAFPQGLKPHAHFPAASARLKSCPDTSCPSRRVFPRASKSCPDTRQSRISAGRSFSAACFADLFV